MDRETKAYSEVKELLGNASSAWEKLTAHIRYHYEMDEIWKAGNPKHKHYNNLYFKRGGKSFAIAALRQGHFLVAVVLGAAEREKFETQRAEFSEAVLALYDEAETLHDGKWLGFELYDDALIDDIIKLLEIKRKPNRKILPKNMDNCGKLDIGLPHGEITKILLGE